MSTSRRRLAERILDWAHGHPRDLPWKESKDPYRIWIAEIMHQQTQVSQGIRYYKTFLNRFPTVSALAEAPEDEVLRMWQGLGYNSRARHLHQAAQTIVREFHGKFPSTYEEIAGLKGVGAYTAAAIASFAFGLPTPVLDSNVIRVLARVFGIDKPPASRSTREEMLTVLKDMLGTGDPAEFNQAMMDFGALQCRPRNPECPDCVLRRHCVAFQEGLVGELPLKQVRRPRRRRYFHYYLITDGERIILRKRTDRDIWRHMYEFPMIETGDERHPIKRGRASRFPISCLRISGRPEGGTRLSQTLTH